MSARKAKQQPQPQRADTQKPAPTPQQILMRDPKYKQWLEDSTIALRTMLNKDFRGF